MAAPPDQMILDQTAGLSGDDNDLGQAIQAMARVAKVTKPKAVDREFHALFIGLGRGELLPYSSYYLTGFLNEKPLAQLRQDMLARSMTRAPNVYEPEDDIASLMEMMAGMIVGRFGTPADLETQRTFWKTHIGPWANHFFADLEAPQASVFCASVGTAGRIFMEIEREAFRMTAGYPRISPVPNGAKTPMGPTTIKEEKAHEQKAGRRHQPPRFPETSRHRSSCCRSRCRSDRGSRRSRAAYRRNPSSGYGAYQRLPGQRPVLNRI